MATRHDTLQQARTALSSGHANAAARKCAKLLLADPRDVEARHLNGRCHAALGQWVRAVDEFRRVLSVRPGFYPALVDMGVAKTFAGEIDEAHRLLEQARMLDARPAEVHFGLGICRMEMGDLRGAADAFRESLARNAGFPDAYNNLGVVHDRLGQIAEAVECFRRAIAVHPDFAAAHRNLGSALLRLGQPSAAAAAFKDAAAFYPGDAAIFADLGAAQLAATDFAAAVTSLEQALAHDGQLASAAANLGEALRNLKAPEESVAAFRHALAIRPDVAEAYLGLAKLAASRRDLVEAAAHAHAAQRLKPNDSSMALTVAGMLEQFDRPNEAAALLHEFAQKYPNDADVHDAQGALHHRSGNLSEALASYGRALAIGSNRAETLLNRGRALESKGSTAEAIESIERALAIRPNHAETIAALASCAFRVCSWDLAANSLTELRNTPGGIDLLHPFLILASDLEPAEQAQSLRRRATQLPDPMPTVPMRYAHDRLRVAYVSPDFRDHPVAHALAGVIDLHDRRRITPIAISLTEPDNSGIGLRLRTAFDEFIDGSALSDFDLAQLMRRLEVDVAIDLGGHTAGARPAIFAHRAAPVQVNYLGFPGSTGLESMDYIVADEIVLPTSDESLYSERVLRMPSSYLPFDGSRTPAHGTVSRSDAGLPSQGIVFCAFNNGYKITRDVFHIWMSLLRDVPESVLWLRSSGAATSSNLKSAATACGVSPDRLIFSPYIASMDAHMARLQMADLFLDTLPYNAHTSAAEALWAGVPVITCRGRTFAGRVGASLLTTAGFPELICTDLEGYRTRALDLARSPTELSGIRKRLVECRAANALFDTERYTRALECLLLAVTQSHA